MDGYLNVRQAAAALGVSGRTVRDRLLTGSMTGELLYGYLWIVPQEEVERWKVLGRQKPGRKPLRKGKM